MIPFIKIQLTSDSPSPHPDAPTDADPISFDPEYIHPVRSIAWGQQQVLIRAEETPALCALVIDLESHLLVVADRQVREISKDLSHRLIWESTTPIYFAEVSVAGAYLCVACDIDIAVINLNGSTIVAQSQYREVISDISLSPTRVVVRLIDDYEQEIHLAPT